MFKMFMSLLCIAALTGCNTMQGIGKDLQQLGEKIQRATNRAGTSAPAQDKAK